MFLKTKIMEKKFKMDVMSAYESPSVVELHVANEGVLCASKGSTERLVEVEGSWYDVL